ncbi:MULTISPECIES: hypothetical protein [unclassified Ruminococcus]|uniref:hypothetical protein n=1 Tax=unclassified Ruminococcus TaxID=2608920 RepID=UPI00210C6AAE|nr:MULTISPECIES: hypothetical protein [unclassified Ruminococcus]MCQ4114098.1 hypothetical protein [Ruminococcus sp. zg-921]
MKRKPNFRYAAACLCVATMLCGGFIALQHTVFSENSDSSKADLGFIVTAYAAEPNSSNGTKLNSVDAKISPFIPTINKELSSREYDSQGKQISEDNPLSEGETPTVLNDVCGLGFDNISLEISGEDIESFDITSDNGYFNYVNMDAYREYHNNEGTNIDKYFKKGNSIIDIPFDSENPNNSIVNWYPSSEKLNNEIEETLGLNVEDYYNDYETAKAVSPEIDIRLQSAEDFTNYFGATIKITVHHKDGTLENGRVCITFDEKGYAGASITKA